MGHVELHRRVQLARLGQARLAEFAIPELQLFCGRAETITEQQSQHTACQDAALAVYFEVKPAGPRALLLRQEVRQARKEVLRLIQARTPHVDLSGGNT